MIVRYLTVTVDGKIALEGWNNELLTTETRSGIRRFLVTWGFGGAENIEDLTDFMIGAPTTQLWNGVSSGITDGAYMNIRGRGPKKF